MGIKREHASAVSDLIDTVSEVTDNLLTEARKVIDKADNYASVGLTLLGKVQDFVDDFVEGDDEDAGTNAPVEPEVSREDKVQAVSSYNGYDPVLVRQFSDNALDMFYNRVVEYKNNANRWGSVTDDVLKAPGYPTTPRYDPLKGWNY